MGRRGMSSPIFNLQLRALPNLRCPKEAGRHLQLYTNTYCTEHSWIDDEQNHTFRSSTMDKLIFMFYNTMDAQP